MDVTMLFSVDDYVSGENYTLEDDLSDRFILNAYADGELSRVYTAEEIETLTANKTTVVFY